LISPDNNVVVNVNHQIIVNGMDVANESLKMYCEFIENIIKFNANIIRMA
jgi:hypothetical protein